MNHKFFSFLISWTHASICGHIYMDDDFDYDAIQEYEDQLYKDDDENSQQR